jgi:hypothetical protein
MDDFIEIYENAVPKKVCEYFIKFFEEQDRSGNTWAGTMGGGHVSKEWKNCTDLNIRRDETVQEYKAFDNPRHLKMLDKYEKLVDKKFAEYFRKYDAGLGVKLESMQAHFHRCKRMKNLNRSIYWRALFSMRTVFNESTLKVN